MGVRSSSAISENSIVFFEGGHDHDGISSSLIDVERYSIYDFTVGLSGSSGRQARQRANFNNLKTVISNVVINDVLGPSGVRLLPNSVQSVHIQAGSITANELSANIILVNNIIKSNNYVSGSSGWIINGNGVAEFDAASIRGTLTAAAVSTPGVDIHANGVLQASNFIIEANGAFGNNNFAVDASGNLFANNANITGVIEATGGLIGDLEISNGQLVYTDNINDTGLMLGPRSFPTNDGSPALVISSSFSSGSFTSVRAVGIDMTGNINCNAVDSEFLTVTNTISGDINGNASTADQATTALNADKLDNFFASTNDSINTVAVRGNDASVRAGYLVMLGGVGTGVGDEVRKRSDGYLLTFTSRRELKNSIENIDSDFALSTMNSLQPVSFRMNEQQYIGDLFSEKEATYREYGFIAQDIAEIDVNLATYSSNAEGDAIQPQAWSSHAMISLSVSAIKGLISELNELKSKVSELESYLFNGPNNEV